VPSGFSFFEMKNGNHDEISQNRSEIEKPHTNCRCFRGGINSHGNVDRSESVRNQTEFHSVCRHTDGEFAGTYEDARRFGSLLLSQGFPEKSFE